MFVPISPVFTSQVPCGRTTEPGQFIAPCKMLLSAAPVQTTSIVDWPRLTQPEISGRPGVEVGVGDGAGLGVGLESAVEAAADVAGVAAELGLEAGVGIEAQLLAVTFTLALPIRELFT